MMPCLIDAVKQRAVVAAVARGLDEVRDVIRRPIGEQVEHDRAGRRLDHRLLVAQFVGRVRILETSPAPPAAPA